MTFREYIERDDLPAEEELEKLNTAFANLYPMWKLRKDPAVGAELAQMTARKKTLEMRLFMSGNDRHHPERRARKVA
jgi:hypothetical protein